METYLCRTELKPSTKKASYSKVTVSTYPTYLKDQEGRTYKKVKNNADGMIGQRIEQLGGGVRVRSLYGIDSQHAQDLDENSMYLTHTMEDGEVVNSRIYWDKISDELLLSFTRLGINTTIPIPNEKATKLTEILNRSIKK